MKQQEPSAQPRRLLSARDIWQRIDCGSPDECWPYRGPTNREGGYGMLHVAGRDWVASRWVWTQTHGPIPDGLLVLHSCDNPPCCNPRHLRLGTDADNAADRVARGRSIYVRGAQVSTAKLTDEDVVREIRKAHARGVKQTELAAQHGVHKGTIWDIVHRRSWKHVI